jgi:outer membrane biosynthesis protein TonB
MIATRSLRARAVLAVAGLGLAGSLLTGCSTGNPDLTTDAAAGLQDGVLAVTAAAAAGDYAGAQAALGTVQTDLTTASANEGVTPARSTEIQAAIDLVAADLATAVAGGPVDAPAEEPEEVPVETPVEPAPLETPTETPSPTPDDTEEPDDVDEPDEDESPEPGPGTENSGNPGNTGNSGNSGKDRTETGACVKKDKCD